MNLNWKYVFSGSPSPEGWWVRVRGPVHIWAGPVSDKDDEVPAELCESQLGALGQDLQGSETDHGGDQDIGQRSQARNGGVANKEIFQEH